MCERICLYASHKFGGCAKRPLWCLAKETIEKRPLYTKFLFFEYTKGDRDGIHTKEPKESLQAILYNAAQSKWCSEVRSRHSWLHDYLV